jgi:hypothetical protein
VIPADVAAVDHQLTRLAAWREQVPAETFFYHADRLLDMRLRAALIAHLEREYGDQFGVRAS